LTKHCTLDGQVYQDHYIDKTCSSSTIKFPLDVSLSLPLKTKLLVTPKQLPDMAILQAEYISEKHNLAITYMHLTEHISETCCIASIPYKPVSNFSCMKAETSKRTL